MTKADTTRIGTGRLSLLDIVEVARNFRPVNIAPENMQRIKDSHHVVKTIVANDVKAYGITTGFASLRDTVLKPEEASLLSENLIRSHASGLGDPFPEDVVRASILIRLNALAMGNSGVSPELVNNLIYMLNQRIYPFVPQQGSVGSSGDLAPLSHLFLVTIGEPFARLYKPSLLGNGYIAKPREQDFIYLHEYEGRHKLPYVTLGPKEGLGLNNGAVFSTALLALGVYDIRKLVLHADLSAALTYEATRAVPDHLRESVVSLRPHSGHTISAQNIKNMLEKSELVPMDYPSALNMAAWNMAMVELARINLTGLSEEDQKAIRHMRDFMATKQAVIRQEIEQHKARVVNQSPRARESQACKMACEELNHIWESYLMLVDQSHPDMVVGISEQMRRTLSGMYQNRILKIFPSNGQPAVQDNYCLRATPTVHGPLYRALGSAEETMLTEINSTTDNPIIVLDEIYSKHQAMGGSMSFTDWVEQNLSAIAHEVVSGANFHGEPIGKAADYLGIALSEIANISERRIALLTTASHSKGLPSYLAWKAGLNSGFMIPQYAAANIASETKFMANPASVDSIPTGENSEDHVAMSTFAGKKLHVMIENVTRVLAVEMACATLAIQFQQPAKSGLQMRAVLGTLKGEDGKGLGHHILQQVIASRFSQTQGTTKLAAFERVQNMSPDELDAEFRKELKDMGLGDSAVAKIDPCVTRDVVSAEILHRIETLIKSGRLLART